MISGLNQQVEILGRTFHFQTELSDQDGLSIRTEVFVGGKVVATRESQLASAVLAEMDPAELRARMKAHHNKTLDSFVERAQRYQQRGEAPPDPSLVVPPPDDAAAPEDAAAPAPEPPAERPRGMAPPSPEAREAVAGALRVRRFFGRFRELMGPTSAFPEDPGDRLGVMARAFGWMIQSELFGEIRIDEQMRCHLLKEQIEEWLESGRDPHVAARIWSGIVTFNNYLAEINHRADLQAYDQQMLLWALGEVERRGMSPEVFKGLETLYGLDPRLDQLLDEPQELSDGAWTAHLRRALTAV